MAAMDQSDMERILATTDIRQHCIRECGQAEHLVQFTIGEQPRVRGNPRPVKLQLKKEVGTLSWSISSSGECGFIKLLWHFGSINMDASG